MRPPPVLHPSDAMLMDLFREAPPDRLEPIYKRHGVATSDGVELLVSEICLDGANSVMSVIRGGSGVPYESIVRSVADRIKVKANKNESLQAIEIRLLENLISS